MADAPSTTRPSVATFSPGRTTNRSPTTRESTGTDDSTPPRSTVAFLAPNSSRARSAALESRFARASIYRPARMKTVTTAATSR